MKSRTIQFDYSAAEPLMLAVDAGSLVADCRGPEGATEAVAGRLVAEAVASPPSGPPLAAHVVPGDRVAIALAGDIPQQGAVTAAVVEALSGAGVSPDDITLLHARPLEPLPAGRAEAMPGEPPAQAGLVHEFHPAHDAETAYLLADEEARPLHLARTLVDADVVVAVGGWGFDAALGGRSLEGEVWPTFARETCRRNLVTSLAKRGRRALADWRSHMQAITWQRGVAAGLRLVAGRGDTLAAASFGLPDSAARDARQLAPEWSPAVSAPAAVAICSLARPDAGFAAITRAVAAAARVTRPDATICIASTVAAPPGTIFTRWRQGAPLAPLVHEAIGTGDPALIADAVQTRFFARALEDRRLVLLSGLDESLVEDLEFGFADSPAVVERLAKRADSLVLLHEADRMFPRLT
ncbi:MAG: hypothetical protein ACK6DO_05315 [Planctomycetia bacterium]